MIRRMLSPVMVLAVTLIVGTAVRADDAADAKSLVEKAIKASGGAEKLDKTKSVTTKIKGKITVMGMDLDLKATTTTEEPDRMRSEADVEFMGNQIKQLQIVNKDKGWLVVGDMNLDATKEMLESAKETFYASYVGRLTPLLKDKQFKLSLIPDIKVDGQDAAGILVKSEGHGDMKVYFDKKTNLPVKTEGARPTRKAAPR